MRVIENKIEREMTCPHCGSRIAYDSEDIINSNGKEWIYCGACGEEISLDKPTDRIAPDLKPPFYCSNCEHDFVAEPHIGADGSLFATCPTCGDEIWVGSGIELNAKNIEYPTHFFSYKNGVKMTDEQIIEWVRQAASAINKDVDYQFISGGNTMVIAVKSDEDSSEATVFVCKNYAECNFKIPRENF